MSDSKGTSVFLQVPASFRTAATAVVLVLGVGVFGVVDAWAKTRTVVINCPTETEKKIKLDFNEDKIDLQLKGCFCHLTRETAKLAVRSGKYQDELSSWQQDITMNEGETVKRNFYCYTMDQFKSIAPKGN